MNSDGCGFNKHVDIKAKMTDDFIKLITSWHDAVLIYINTKLKIHSRDLSVDANHLITRIYYEKENSSTLICTIESGSDLVSMNQTLSIKVKPYNGYEIDMNELKEIHQRLKK